MKKLLTVVLIMLFVCIGSSDTLLSEQDNERNDKSAVYSAYNNRPTAEGTKIVPEHAILGYSSRGNVIEAVTITPAKYEKTVLLTFAMHGFEDSWDYDGASLVQMAHEIISAFSENPAYLNKTRLIVVPCVNPDGLLRGFDDRIAGRCNGQGIDINRDFDYLWKYCGEAKYHTGDTPFASPEANILKNLVLNEEPDLVIDFHGWLNAIYGDEEIGQYFSDSLQVSNQGLDNVADAFLPQTFIGWAGQHTRAVMVEYPNPQTAANVVKFEYSCKTIEAIKQICRQI